MHNQLPNAILNSAGKPGNVEFNAIGDTVDGQMPATSTWSSWGKGDDLLIQRLSLDEFFHRLLLANRNRTDPTNYPPTLVVPPATAGVPVMTNYPFVAHFLDGTAIVLTSNVTVQTSHLMKRDVSFVFERGNWRGQIGADPNPAALTSAFADAAEAFRQANWNFRAGNNGGKGANQKSILSYFYDYMISYIFWANECPNFNDHSANPIGQLPQYNMLQTIVGNADTTTGNNPSFGLLGKAK
jgi:hypothetical protein